MESPFDSVNNTTTVLYLETMLNSHFQSYQKVLTVSNIPVGPLAGLVSKINSPRLSQFQSASRFSPPPTSRNSYSQMCLLTLCRYPVAANIKYADNFMYAADIPNVIGYLESNGYRIMTDVTHLAYRGPVDYASPSPGGYNSREVVFIFKYEGSSSSSGI
jgi:hypothetical protein